MNIKTISNNTSNADARVERKKGPTLPTNGLLVSRS